MLRLCVGIPAGPGCAGGGDCETTEPWIFSDFPATGRQSQIPNLAIWFPPLRNADLKKSFEKSKEANEDGAAMTAPPMISLADVQDALKRAKDPAWALQVGASGWRVGPRDSC